MMERDLRERLYDIQQQAMDVTDYLCSRGDTMLLREKVELQTRRVLHALAQKGWEITRKDTSGG